LGKKKGNNSKKGNWTRSRGNFKKRKEPTSQLGRNKGKRGTHRGTEKSLLAGDEEGKHPLHMFQVTVTGGPGQEAGRGLVEGKGEKRTLKERNKKEERT